MFCPKCGWQNADDIASCANCSQELQAAQPGVPQQPQQPQQPPAQQPYPQQPYDTQQYAQGSPVSVPDYLIWSILVTLFCCLPFGIVAIVKSAEANSKKNIGDYNGAMQAAQAARTWTLVSFGIGLAIGVIYAAVMIIGIASGGPGFLN